MLIFRVGAKAGYEEFEALKKEQLRSKGSEEAPIMRMTMRR
jgi:hypothetical protein